MWGSPQQCLAPAAYNTSMLQHLVAAICYLDTVDGTQPACAVATADVANCTRGRADALTLVTPAASGRCCNAVRVAVNASGTTIRYLQCRGDAVGVWLGVVGLAFACLLLIFIANACVRRVRADRRRAELAAAEAEMTKAASPDMGASTTRNAAPRAPLGARMLADALLYQMSDTVRAQRVARFARAVRHFGFQESSAANQMKHFESLLLSHMSQEGDGDPERALRSLHRALLLPFQRWRVQTSGVGTATLAKQGYLQLDETTAAHLPDSWATATPSALEEEVMLFLLIWGEAANLRFMPELLFFLLELMRAHVPQPHAPAAPPNSFLQRVVRPVYQLIFSEVFEMGANGKPIPHRDMWLSNVHRNYDDWNERFWTLPALFELRTRSGQVVMAVPTHRRWTLLLDADWKRFFAATPKTFREHRWWYCLLASNRRIFLAHALTFAVCFMAALPSGPQWTFNGWGAARIVPFLLILGAISRALGRTFEWWAMQSFDARRNAISAYLHLTLLITACVINVYETEVHTPSQVDLRVYVPTMCFLCVGGIGILALEMLPQRTPTGTSLDDNLTFERRTAALLHEPWLTDDGLPRHELIAVVRMYIFWAVRTKSRRHERHHRPRPYTTLTSSPYPRTPLAGRLGLQDGPLYDHPHADLLRRAREDQRLLRL